MYGTAIGAAMASDSDTQYIDNMAVTKCANHRSKHECSNADIRHKVCDQVQQKRVAAEWVTRLQQCIPRRQAYTARWYSDWQHHIKHALKWWWEHKRDWYESQVKQMSIPRGRKRNRPKDHRAQWTDKRPRT